MGQKLRRANVNDTLKMSLLCDVGGRCPLCSLQLLSNRQNKLTRVFDVAHIYPLNATDKEKALLKNEERLSKEINCEENYIPLCKPCHKIYDTKKTVEEYRQLVAIKKQTIKTKSLIETWDNQSLHEDISNVVIDLENLSQSDINKAALSLDALKLKDKTDNSFGLINESKVTNYIVNFYNPIDRAFKRIEKQRSTTTFIFTQIRSYYCAQVFNDLDQSEIFENMCRWIMSCTSINSTEKSEVIVSYFIQHCEVFSS